MRGMGPDVRRPLFVRSKPAGAARSPLLEALYGCA